ncbi:DUF4861 domain-containing protein [Alphaproteobacteria bacterium]|nr:DUF4861 domain-containing protein [Alphaproteobacteria bacterium]
MKKVVCLFCTLLVLTACSSQSKTLQVTVENPSDFDRTSDLVEVPLVQIESSLHLQDGQVYEVTNSQKEIIPSQLTSDAKLLFQSGLKAREKAVFTIGVGAGQAFEPKTTGRFVRERFDDFAWENDRVAFRIYGHALIEKDGPSNGLDIWYKRTSEMFMDKRYQDEIDGIASYHNDNGQGLDDYNVRRSLGAGAMAPYVGETLWLNENFIAQELVDKGPLRTTFKLTYKDIEVDGKAFSESRTFSIDAGSQLTKVTQEYGTTEAILVAAGIVKRESGDSIIADPDKYYVEYLEPKTNKVDGIYIGIVFPQAADNILTDDGHVLAVTTYKPGRAVVYYTGYGWNKYGFTDAADFQKYLANFAKALNAPLIISVCR